MERKQRSYFFAKISEFPNMVEFMDAPWLEHAGILPKCKGCGIPGFPKVISDLSYGWNLKILVKKYGIQKL